MSISAVGSSGGIDRSQMASKMASRMVKDMDADGDGSVNKAEFVKGLAAKGVSADEAGKRFDAIDTKHAGTVSQGDIETAIKAGGAKKPSGAGGPPPGGGAKPGGAAKSSDTKSYDKKDANKDGTVSTEEELVYDLSHVDAAGAKKSGAQRIGQNLDVTV